jgi:hypothetical protein
MFVRGIRGGMAGACGGQSIGKKGANEVIKPLLEVVVDDLPPAHVHE